jgi:hypothetical protein
VSESGGLRKDRVVSIRQPTATAANRFEISDPEKDLLGRGETGRAYRGTDTQTGQAVELSISLEKYAGWRP